jgi:hypothetical protein
LPYPFNLNDRLFTSFAFPFKFTTKQHSSSLQFGCMLFSLRHPIDCFSPFEISTTFLPGHDRKMIHSTRPVACLTKRNTFLSCVFVLSTTIFTFYELYSTALWFAAILFVFHAIYLLAGQRWEFSCFHFNAQRFHSSFCYVRRTTYIHASL